jgi:hypothetical protein
MALAPSPAPWRWALPAWSRRRHRLFSQLGKLIQYRVLHINRRAAGSHPLYPNGQTKQQVASFLAQHRGGAGN